MAPETLLVDLDNRIRNSPRFKATSISEYFQSSRLDWWKPTQEEYVDQENLIGSWLERQWFAKGLEIGPGFGRITKLIFPQVEELDLVEINQKAIKDLSRQFPTTNIFNTNVENFDMRKGKYDLVVAVEVLVHVPDISGLLESISQSLDKNGVFITSITPSECYGNKYTVIHRGIDPLEFEMSLAQNGLSVLEKSQIGHHLTYCLVKE